ncbi:hypothetical protein PHYPSEUDO_008512 [Phytophthora pseudosyringae]|uniref:RxLR effector protein n=1 Tax=Phytophthora pseudosyringae TaxID=221518 RepID=A0A8T1VE17_9STRA|nr:hypothetical protein PHYPSEUDO_008512 [Phytophthora pseudosyringae]
MRFAYVLLVAAATLVASGNALTTDADTGKRLLRSHKTVDTTNDAEEEERALDKSTVKKLPQLFQDMYKQPSRLDYIFSSWHSGLQSVDNVVEFMKKEGLEFDAIMHFVEAYRKYIAAHKSPF